MGKMAKICQVSKKKKKIPNCHILMISSSRWSRIQKDSSFFYFLYMVCSRIRLNYFLDNRHFHFTSHIIFKKKILESKSELGGYQKREQPTDHHRLSGRLLQFFTAILKRSKTPVLVYNHVRCCLCQGKNIQKGQGTLHIH